MNVRNGFGGTITFKDQPHQGTIRFVSWTLIPREDDDSKIRSPRIDAELENVSRAGSIMDLVTSSGGETPKPAYLHLYSTDKRETTTFD